MPFASKTFTASMCVPGATPTTPVPLFLAPIVPATCVPWPSSSFGSPVPRQLVPAETFRSGLVRSTPVSTTATVAVEACRADVVVPAPILRTPVGMVSPANSGASAVA